MKRRIFAAFAALVVAASSNAQSTVDSIASKYKLLPMPGALTLEQTFPVLGSYQLENSTEGIGTLTVSMDSASKGIVWVEGLPQGKVKAYLRKSPATYRILSQKTGTGKQVQEGTLHYDTTSHQLHIALGKTYDQADPTAIFASSMDMTASADMDANGETETKVKSGDTKMKTEMKGNKMKVKTKTGDVKNKTKIQFYTATKIMQDNMMNGNMQMQQTDSTQQQIDSTHQQ